MTFCHGDLPREMFNRDNMMKLGSFMGFIAG